jgi:hypothetical protein
MVCFRYCVTENASELGELVRQASVLVEELQERQRLMTREAVGDTADEPKMNGVLNL